MTIKKLREQSENFNQEISKEFYLQGAGLKNEIDLDAIYSKYPDIHKKENIDLIYREIENNKDNPTEISRLNILLENLYNEIMGFELSDLAMQELAAETNGTIEIDNKRVPFRSVMGEILKTHERERRNEIELKKDEFLAKEINPIAREAKNKTKK